MATGATERDKVILAYSGGLDTSVMVPWIGEKYNLDVVAFTVDLGQGEDIERIRQKALRHRGGGRRRHRRPQPVRRLLRLPGPDGRCHVRRQVSAGHGAGPAADRQADGRRRPRAQRQGGRARLHRQGQRSGAFRRDLPDFGTGFEDHRSGARMEDEPRRVAGVRRQAQHPGRGDQGKPVQRRPEPVGPQLRGRRAGRPVGRAAGRRLSPGRPTRSRRRTSRSTSTSTSSRASRSGSTVRRWMACR